MKIELIICKIYIIHVVSSPYFLIMMGHKPFISVCAQVVALKEDGCPKVWVVTSDSCQQQAAHGAVCFILCSLI